MNLNDCYNDDFDDIDDDEPEEEPEDKCANCDNRFVCFYGICKRPGACNER